ncbi:DUF6602 domain-containing protein [Listeria sp. ILCC792]|uniref:DUF6602 domain-containing protein n=1 Tax=Listeria sp. ILCC792 TaxID=1918331 RepID=UPI000B5918A1|nr:DUF6602 domain-containing protein [Listeria sp. ILCC792]
MGDREDKALRNIRDNYRRIEQSIVEQLYMENNIHGTTVGTMREEVWKSFFESIIPKKFAIERSVFIIDSNGTISNEVDLAIFDEMYTPYIFKYRNMKFIPIEAVAVVVECKSKNANDEKLNRWAESIKDLETSQTSWARMAIQIAEGNSPTQEKTRPIRILCCMHSRDNKNFDFIIQALRLKNNDLKLLIKCNYRDNNLLKWIDSLNGLKGTGKQQSVLEKELNSKEEKVKRLFETTLAQYEVPGTSILTFNFQLNQLLMLINNPMLFPHQAYAKMFRELEE